MAELRVDDIPDIIKYTVIELRRLYKNRNYFSYHLKCSFIELLVQYMFAVYAKTRIKEGDNYKIITVVGKNIISMYNPGKRSDLGKFISDLCELRNEVAHARQLPKTIDLVENFWDEPLFDELLHILSIDISPFDTM